jgi:uncharacterized membrane protein YhhN
MSYWWLGIPLAIAVLDWAAISRNWVVVHAFAKQGVMIALIAWSWFSTDWKGLLIWFGLALVFSLAGDIFLLSPRLFLPGLVAFLLAHIAYLLGLNLNTSLLSVITFGVVLGAAGLAALIYPPIRAGLRRKPDTQILAIPVLVYGFILSLMMLSAVATLFRIEWTNVWTAILMAAGGILFFISDNILARDRFVHPIRNGQLQVMVTYHLAQMALITGALLHFFTLKS